MPAPAREGGDQRWQDWQIRPHTLNAVDDDALALGKAVNDGNSFWRRWADPDGALSSDIGIDKCTGTE